MSEYKYGDPIPEKYRNHLFEWKGGGYDGCFWEMNQGLVDEDGHWRPLYSSGYDGIDNHEWLDRKLTDLRSELGYGMNPDAEYSEVVYKAIKKVFGDDWWKIDGPHETDPRVQEMVKGDRERHDEYERRKKAIREECMHRQDDLFMLVVKSLDTEAPMRGRWNDFGLIDDDHIKETCRRFCESYSENVGMMTHALDKMSKYGYDPWCTCSDCGEQFQTGYESFSCCMDDKSYHGDGGIGVIMTRVLCDQCNSEVECPSCFEKSLPNPNIGDKDNIRSMYDSLTSLLLLDWIGVCYGCADGYSDKYLRVWNEKKHISIPTRLGDVVSDAEEAMKKKFGTEDIAEAYEAAKKTEWGVGQINRLRDALRESAGKYFGPGDFEDLLDSRLEMDGEDCAYQVLKDGVPVAVVFDAKAADKVYAEFDADEIRKIRKDQPLAGKDK